MTNIAGFAVLLFYFLLLAVSISLVVYLFNRLNKIISLLEEIKEKSKARE